MDFIQPSYRYLLERSFLHEDRTGRYRVGMPYLCRHQPAMRADILRHRVKVVFPCILEDMIIAEELDAAAVDLGFDLVP